MPSPVLGPVEWMAFLRLASACFPEVMASTRQTVKKRKPNCWRNHTLILAEMTMCRTPGSDRGLMRVDAIVGHSHTEGMSHPPGAVQVPALSMIQGRQPARRSSFSREYSVVPERSRAVFIE